MSLFLPEGEKTPSLQSPGVAQPSSPEVTDADLKIMQRVLSAAAQYPNMIPDTFMAYVLDFIQTSRLQIPIGQVFGFSRFTLNVATRVETTFSTSSTAWIASGDGGPFLDGIPAGAYLVLYGGTLWTTATTANSEMGVAVNGVAPVNGISSPFNVAGISVSGVLPVTLSAPSNRLEAFYQTTNAAVTASASARWLIALLYDNP